MLGSGVGDRWLFEREVFSHLARRQQRHASLSSRSCFESKHSNEHRWNDSSKGGHTSQNQYRALMQRLQNHRQSYTGTNTLVMDIGPFYCVIGRGGKAVAECRYPSIVLNGFAALLAFDSLNGMSSTSPLVPSSCEGKNANGTGQIKDQEQREGEGEARPVYDDNTRFGFVASRPSHVMIGKELVDLTYRSSKSLIRRAPLSLPLEHAERTGVYHHSLPLWKYGLSAPEVHPRSFSTGTLMVCMQR